jgi:alpha/beta superfamily hydrolase
MADDARRTTIGAGLLEAVVEDPGSPSGRYAVLCHPHPLFGGTMDNKVVTTLAGAFREGGVPSIRFNFRGVGRSPGVYDAGVGETADAEAVASWGATRWPGRSLIIAGFSFGAYVAMRLSQQRPASQLITVAPPVGMFDFADLTVGCEWLVVQGDADDVVDPKSVIDWVGGMKNRPQLLLMPGVGHFFHGRLGELREGVRDAVVGAIKGG